MSLGVLNNISAIYAQNNLNQTSNSLQNTLTQLSSGSRINSGADDAAGLSLANGLGANSAALTQSATNASSGVGLLQVADGALSQVTNLLNRAVTLATESSNGTLNSTQDAAANQEYQSILAEVNNIGAATTFNGVSAFGSSTAIYTGDATTLGSSIDTLSIKALTSSSVGDVGGVDHRGLAIDVAQHPIEQVERHHGPEIADVGVVVDRRAADIHCHPLGIAGNERTLFARHGVVQGKIHGTLGYGNGCPIRILTHIALRPPSGHGPVSGPDGYRGCEGWHASFRSRRSGATQPWEYQLKWTPLRRTEI